MHLQLCVDPFGGLWYYYDMKGSDYLVIKYMQGGGLFLCLYLKFVIYDSSEEYLTCQWCILPEENILTCQGIYKM